MGRKKSKEEPIQEVLDLSKFISALDKKHGGNAVCIIGNKKPEKVSAISTGSYQIDRATGIGGVPRGRITEIFGAEGAGKTTLTSSIMANAQRMNLNVALIDAEHAFDFYHAQSSVGLDPNRLVFSQPNSGEDALQLVRELAASKLFGCIVVDSTAALTPKSELEGEVSDQRIGEQARMISKALRVLSPVVHESNTALIFINQLRAKIGGYGPNPETTPGGNALKYYASMRIRVSGKLFPDFTNPKGITISARMTKNKCAIPNKTGAGDFRFVGGFWEEKDVLEAAIDAGILIKTGAWIKSKDGKTSYGCGIDSSAEAITQEQLFRLKEILALPVVEEEQVPTVSEDNETEEGLDLEAEEQEEVEE